jgi:hypothetical protein
LCADLGIELKMLSFSDVHSFEAGFHLFFNPIGRHNLVKHNAELSISAQPARGMYLQDRTLQPAALGEKQMIGGDERLSDDRFHRVPLLAGRGTEGRDEYCVHHAHRWRQRSDVLQYRGRKRLGSEIQRPSQFRVKAVPGIHVLRMVRELCDREPLQSVHLPWLVKLFFCGIPLPLQFHLGFLDLSRSGVPGLVFLTLFLFFLFAGGARTAKLRRILG